MSLNLSRVSNFWKITRGFVSSVPCFWFILIIIIDVNVSKLITLRIWIFPSRWLVHLLKQNVCNNFCCLYRYLHCQISSSCNPLITLTRINDLLFFFILYNVITYRLGNELFIFRSFLSTFLIASSLVRLNIIFSLTSFESYLLL